MLRETDVFDAQGFSFADVGEQKAPALVTVEHGAHGVAATISDAHLLFNSDFTRSGNDLHIDGHSGDRAIVRDYFGTGERAALMSAEGARLSPDLVEALTKSVAPHQYAQATPPAPAASDAVGRVVTASPDSTILRNGVPVTVTAGDPVLRADVLQTAGGTMAVTFNDGSTLNLTANTRIVVSEFIYSPSNTGNSQLLDLIQGSLTFISGEVAHTGDMRIGTPVATMGIRGTVGGVTTASDGTVQFYVSQSATGAVIINQQGQIIANVVQDGPLIVVRPVGPLQVIADEIQKSPAQLAVELQALQQIVNIKAVGDQLLQQFFQQQQQQNPNPQSPQNGPHTQIPVDDKLKITLFLDDKGGGNGGVAPATHAVIERVVHDPDGPPTPIPLPITVNLSPVTFAPLSLTTAEDTPLVFSGSKAISVIDNDSQTLTLTLSITNGVLSLGSVAGLSFSSGDGANDGAMTFSGSPAAIAAALNGLTYTPSQDYNGPATLSISAGDGNSAPLTTTVTLDVTPVNDAPVLNFFNVNVSGDDPVVLTSSDFSVTDPDSSDFTFTVTNVTGGEFVVDSGSNNLFSMQLFQQGPVTFTAADIAAGRVSFVPDGSGDPVSYTVSVSDGIDSSPVVEDHLPVAKNIEAEVTAGSASSSYNVVIILDVSGSMAGQQLIDAKTAIANLLSNDSISSVMAVSFAGSADVYAGEGGPWVSPEDANDYFQMLGTGGGTNYVGAISAVMAAWNDNAPGAADKTLVYFISDGEPSSGLDGTQTGDWEDFLLAQGVDISYAIGISPNVSATNLEPIAWKPGDAGFDPINLQNTTDLANTLQDTVVGTQNIFTDGEASLGGDGGRILSVTVDGETYTWDGLNTVSSSSQAQWSHTTSSLTVTTALGGILTFYFGDEGQAHAGDWTYSPPETLSATSNEVFHYTLVDNDGDKSSADITISVLSSNVAPVLTGSLTATVNESEVVALTSQQLGFIDQDDDAADVTFTVSNVVNGTIYVGEGQSSTFTGAQLAAGDVFFAHNGSESATASFDVSVEDGNEDDSTPEVRTFNLTVNPVNDAPVVDLNGEGAGVNYTTVGNNDDNPISVFGPDLVISDVDNAMLQSASISVRLANQGEYYTTYGADNLNVDATALAGAVPGQGASGDWEGLHWQATSGSNGMFLEVTGEASAAIYEELLAAVRFWTDSGDLDDRIFTLTVNDGDADSAPVTSTIDLNAPPVVSDVSATSSSLAFTITDPDNSTFRIVGDFANAYGHIDLPSSAAITPAAWGQSGTLQISDLSGRTADVIGLFLGTDGGNTATAPLASLPNVMYGFTGNDELTGGSAADRIFGGDGNDTINGGDGNDVITGGADADILTGGAGADSFAYNAAAELTGDTIDGVHDNANDDTIRLDGAGTYDFATATVSNIDSVNIAVNAAGFNIVLTDDMALTAAYKGTNTAIEGRIRVNATVAVSNDVTIDASDLQAGQRLFVNAANLNGNDTITGGAGTDNINGGAGNDTITGGAGNDDLTGGTGADTFVFHTGFGIDTVSGFDETLDYLQFDQGIFANVAALLAATTDSGANTVIEYDASNKVTLEGVQKVDLLAHTDHILLV